MKIFFAYISFFTAIIGYSQDFHFSQTTRANHQINPAFVGCFNGNIKAEMNWKNQWQGVDKSFRTYGSSFEYSFAKRSFKPPKVFFAAGAHVFRDVSGTIQLGNTNVGGTFSTLVKVNRTARFVLGIQGNYSSIGLSPDKLQWNNQYSGLNFDPSLSNGEGVDFSPFSYSDISFGLAYWYHKKDRGVFSHSPSSAKIGLSAYHLNRPDYNFGAKNSRLPMRFVLHGDAVFKLHENLYFTPILNFMYQNKQNELLLGSIWKYTLKNGSKHTGLSTEWSVSGGIDIRINNVLDAIIPQIFIGAENFSFGLSYDINTSNAHLSTNYKGGFEFSLRFINPDHQYFHNPTKAASSI